MRIHERPAGKWRRAGLGLAAVAVAGLIAGLGPAFASLAPTPAADALIVIKDFTFQGTLTVAPGATVTVRNDDLIMHTLTAVDGSFTTPAIPPAATVTFQAPASPGSFAITCQFHPFMVGTLVVGAGGTPSPNPSGSPPTSPVITIANFMFGGALTVPPGATVTVRNDDLIMHTLTAVDGSFTTVTIQPGTSATFLAPAGPGSFAITCQFHPFMAGTLVVAPDGGSPSPSPSGTPSPSPSARPTPSPTGTRSPSPTRTPPAAGGHVH
jgi:plastocyanin